MARSAKIYLGLLAALVLVAVLSIVTGRTSFVADIESIFPRHFSGSLDAIAGDQVNKQLSQRVVFLSGHSDAQIARDAFEELRAKLNSLKGIVVSGISDDEIQLLTSLHAPAIGALASPVDLAKLNGRDGDMLIQRSLTALYMPGSSVNSKLMGQDPLRLYPAFLNSLSASMGRSEFSSENEKTYIPLTVSLEEDPSGQKVQEVRLRQMDQVVTEMKNKISGLEVLYLKDWLG